MAEGSEQEKERCAVEDERTGGKGRGKGYIERRPRGKEIKVGKYRCFRRRKPVKRRMVPQETKQRERKSAKEREAKESGNEPEEIKLEKEKLSDQS